MIYATPNLRQIRFCLIDAGCSIIRETKEKIVWAGPLPTKSMNIEVSEA